MNGEAAVRNFKYAFAIAGIVAVLAALLLGPAAAGAAVGHPVVRTFSTGAGSEPRGITVDASGNVYTADVGAQRIDKYSSTGARLQFGATAGYVNETSISGYPERPFELASWIGPILAVDRSGGPDAGDIYVFTDDNNGTGDSLVFNPDGSFRGRIGPREQGNCAAAVNQSNGEVFLGSIASEALRRFPQPSGNLSELKPNGEVLVPGGVCGLAVDSTGAVWANYPTFYAAAAKKFEAGQFAVKSSTPVAEIGTAVVAVAVDSADNVYLDESTKLVKYNSAGAQQGVPFGSLVTSRGVAVAPNGDVLASDNGGGVYVYGAGEVEPADGDDGGRERDHQDLRHRRRPRRPRRRRRRSPPAKSATAKTAVTRPARCRAARAARSTPRPTSPPTSPAWSPASPTTTGSSSPTPTAPRWRPKRGPSRPKRARSKASPPPPRPKSTRTRRP